MGGPENSNEPGEMLEPPNYQRRTGVDFHASGDAWRVEATTLGWHAAEGGRENVDLVEANACVGSEGRIADLECASPCCDANGGLRWGWAVRLGNRVFPPIPP